MENKKLYSKIEVMKKVLKNFMECNEVLFNIEVEERYHELIKDSGLKLKNVVSYATRPKRDNETNGVEHWFIDNSTAERIMKKETILAYTKIGDYQYFATKETAIRNKENVYIIDPKGVKWMKEHNPEMNIVEINIRLIDIDKLREERVKERSDYDTAFAKRCADEKEQFEVYENDWNADFIIYNLDFEETLADLIAFIIKENKADMYLIIGRSGVGKDTLMEAAKEMINMVE